MGQNRKVLIKAMKNSIKSPYKGLKIFLMIIEKLDSCIFLN